MEGKKVSVVILNYNGEKMMGRFMPSVVGNTPEWAEVVVADNGSTDGSVGMLRRDYPSVRVVELGRNYGFAEGYNRAIEAVESEFVVMLNSDVEVTKGWLEKLMNAQWDDESLAAVQPKVLAYYNKGKFEHAGACGGYVDRLGYPFCRGRILEETEADKGQYDERAEILWASGAAMMIRRKDYVEVGGMDARFFAHQEEIDLCWRLGARGKRIMCLPESVVYHLGGGTLNVASPKKTYLNFRNNLCLIYKNHEKAQWVLFQRWFLDYLAAMVYLLKRQPEHFKAVLRGRQDYCKLKGEMKADREENMRKAVRKPRGLMGYSILVGRYLRGKKRFGEY